jgi:mono/diheme cytochrome c family protein
VAGAAICGYSIAAAQTDVSTTPTERASAGKLVYQEKCARCHGDALEGRDHAPPLRGAPFRAQWHQKVARALYRRILSTMPLDTPGTLTPQETVSVVVYCLTQNGMRFDAQAIDSADSLNTIHIELTE